MTTRVPLPDGVNGIVWRKTEVPGAGSSTCPREASLCSVRPRGCAKRLIARRTGSSVFFRADFFRRGSQVVRHGSAKAEYAGSIPALASSLETAWGTGVCKKIQRNQLRNMDELYKKDDKIMLKDTGEVLTVLEDLSDRMEPGIVVQEKIGRLLLHCEVLPAGRTRQRRDAAIGITSCELSLNHFSK